MDLKSLQCFVAVAEYLNFSRAAQSLYISQPSLSIRINGLEEELGAPLFFRTHQQVFLTETGAALLPEVREILARIDALPDLAKTAMRQETEPAGQLLIGMDPMEERIDLPFMLEAFQSFQTACPQVELRCSGVDFDDYEEKLLSGEYDICIMILRPSDKVNPMFASVPLLRETMVLFAEDAGAATAEELLQTRDLLMLEHEVRWNRMVLNFLTSQKLKPNIRPVRGTPSLCMNLRSGKAVAFLPLTYAEQLDRDRTSVFDLQIPDSTTTLTAIWNKMNMKPAIQSMVNELSRAVEGKVDHIL